MKKAQVSVYVALFAYGGNGGVASLIPEIAIWLAKIWHQMRTDERIDKTWVKVYADTPITMTRNRALRDAKQIGADLILMIDSDNEPDAYLGYDPEAKPFWDTAFDFTYERLLKGMPTAIGAPYCGPPPNPVPKPGIIDGGEVPYLFEWTNNESDSPDCRFEIALLTRLEATRLKGIFPVAALPTGVYLSTLSCYEPLPRPIFKYEFNADHSEKYSTEDVVATRDVSLYWKMTKGWDVIFAACDSWALHHKPKKVGKPKIVMLESIAEELRTAILTDRSGLEEVRYIDHTDQIPKEILDQAVQLPARGTTCATTSTYIPSHGDDLPPPDTSKIKRKWEILGPDDNHVLITEQEMNEAEVLYQKMQEERAQRAVNTVSDTHSAVEQAEQAGQLWVDQQPDVDPDYATITTANDRPFLHNGVKLRHKMIAGRKVALVNEEEVSDEALEAVQNLANWLVLQKDDAAIDVQVVHSGTGQCCAAILPTLPEGSHLIALDNLAASEHGFKKAEEFAKSFGPELEVGRVFCHIEGGDLPVAGDEGDADLILLEHLYSPEEQLAQWLPYVRPGGVLCGFGYGPKTSKRISSFAKSHNYPLKVKGSLWAIPLRAVSQQKAA